MKNKPENKLTGYHHAGLIEIHKIIRITLLLMIVGLTNQRTTLFCQTHNKSSASHSPLQPVMITGTVTDASTGEALPGVNVLVNGTSIGSITDPDGHYQIDVPDKQVVLVFSCVGYNPQSIRTEGRSVIDIALSPDITQLDEVVVIGYGMQKKVDLTGAVSSVNSKDLDVYPVSGVARTLQGKIPGVTVTPTDGRPDARISVRIRGGGSITQSNDPLFIIDGLPVTNINDIPASQVQNISILKDASSTAIYGARGANGVVLVTTKKPESDRMSISYDGYYQIKQPSNYVGVLKPYDFVLINWEFGTLFGYGDAWAMAYGLGTAYNSLNSGGINNYKTAEFRDIQKDLLKTTSSRSHTFSFSGTSNKTKYLVSVDYKNDDGLKIQSGYKRTSILVKMQNELARNLVLDLDAGYSNQNTLGNEAPRLGSGSALTESMRYTPTTPLGDVSLANSQIGLYDTYVREEFDPVDIMNDIYDKTNNQIIRSNAKLSWTVIKGLTLCSGFGLSKGFRNRYFFKGAIAKNTVGVEGGDATLSREYATSFIWSNTLNYSVNPGDKNRLDIMLGQEINGRDKETSELRGTKYPISFDYRRVFAMMDQFGEQSEISFNNTMDEPNRLASFFGRFLYSFKDRYLFTATIRADGSSNFAPSRRWGYFPAAAVGWRISEEPFLRGSSVVDNLKLRLSYGESGNDQITSGLWEMTWTANSGGYAYNNIGNPYWEPSSTLLPNPDLKWETTVTRNLGVDFEILDSRLYGNVDAYWNTTRDLLMVNQIPAYTGYTSQMANVGQTSNRGIEFLIGGDIVSKTDFKVSASFNITFNRNNIDELSEEIDFFNYSSWWASNSTRPSDGDYSFMVGEPVGLIRGYVYDGFYTTDDFDYDPVTLTYTLKDGVADSRPALGAYPGGFSGVYPGMMKLKKLETENSEVTINDADDVTIIGNTNPKHTGGFSISAMYRKFDLFFGFNWSYGNDVYNANKLSMSRGAKLPFRNFSDAVTGWYHIYDIDASGDLIHVYDPAELDALNANAAQPMPFHESGVVHSGGVEDGSFLRLNNVTLGYTLPLVWTQKVLIQNLRVYTTIYNAFLWTKYTGYDPEVNAGEGRAGSYPTPGMDFGAYPRARTYTFGINVHF